MGLVITRTPGEAVRIGDTLVTLVRVDGPVAKLHIAAPTGVPISRGECLTADGEHPQTSIERSQRHGTQEATDTRNRR